MASVHEQLYNSHNLAEIHSHDFIRKIIDSSLSLYNTAPGQIEIKYNLQDIHLDSKVAISCGLIINELVSNAFKYAFQEGKTGWISIEFYKVDEKTIQLNVSDNGIGFPTDINLEEPQSMGMQIVSMMTQQLGGRLNIQRDTSGGPAVGSPFGTHIQITFSY